MLVEVELKLFVGNVDAELLKRVDSEVLKPENVQDTHTSHSLIPGMGREAGRVATLPTDVPTV